MDVSPLVTRKAKKIAPPIMREDVITGNLPILSEMYPPPNWPATPIPSQSDARAVAMKSGSPLATKYTGRNVSATVIVIERQAVIVPSNATRRLFAGG